MIRNTRNDKKYSQELVRILKEAKQEVSHELEEMTSGGRGKGGGKGKGMGKHPNHRSYKPPKWA